MIDQEVYNAMKKTREMAFVLERMFDIGLTVLYMQTRPYLEVTREYWQMADFSRFNEFYDARDSGLIIMERVFYMLQNMYIPLKQHTNPSYMERLDLLRPIIGHFPSHRDIGQV